MLPLVRWSAGPLCRRPPCSRPRPAAGPPCRRRLAAVRSAAAAVPALSLARCSMWSRSSRGSVRVRLSDRRNETRAEPVLVKPRPACPGAIRRTRQSRHAGYPGSPSRGTPFVRKPTLQGTGQGRRRWSGQSAGHHRAVRRGSAVRRPGRFPAGPLPAGAGLRLYAAAVPSSVLPGGRRAPPSPGRVLHCGPPGPAVLPGLAAAVPPPLPGRVSSVPRAVVVRSPFLAPSAGPGRAVAVPLSGRRSDL